MGKMVIEKGYKPTNIRVEHIYQQSGIEKYKK